MPFKTLEQVWVESCDRPPNNTLSSVYFNVPKTSRHQAGLSGSSYCYSAGTLPISPPVPKSFLLDGSSRKAVVRSSSNLLMGQNDVPVIGKAQFQKDVYVACWRSCIFSQFLFFNLVFSPSFHVRLFETSAGPPKSYHLRNTVLNLLALIIIQTKRGVDLIPLRSKFKRKLRTLTREFIVFKILFCEGTITLLS